MAMQEKTRFTIVAVVSAAAGVVITSLVDRFALRQDLQFLDIANQYVEEGLEKLRKEDEDDD